MAVQDKKYGTCATAPKTSNANIKNKRLAQKY